MKRPVKLCESAAANLGFDCPNRGVVHFPVEYCKRDMFLCVTCAQKIANTTNSNNIFSGKNCFCCTRPATELIYLGSNESFLCAEHKEVINQQQMEHIWEIRMQRAKESGLFNEAIGIITSSVVKDWKPTDFFRTEK